MFAGDFSAAWLDAHDAARIMRGAHHLFMFRLSLQVCKDHASLLATLNGYRCAAILTAKIRIFSVFGSLPLLHRQVLKPASLALGSDLCVPTRQLRGYFLQSASISQHRSVSIDQSASISQHRLVSIDQSASISAKILFIALRTSA